MLLGAIYEALSAAYELSTVVTDVILNYEYINRTWVEEYIMSLVFLGFSSVVLGFVGIGIDMLYPNRFSYNKPFNTAIGFCIGLLQMRVFVETIYSVLAKVKDQRGAKTRRGNADAVAEIDGGGSRTYAVGGHTIVEAARDEGNQQARQLEYGLMYATFIQVIVRDIPLFVLQANATIHYRKWKFIDLFTTISTFVTLARGTTAYVTKEDGNGVKLLGFVFLVGQFAFRLGTILLLAMTKGLTIAVYGLVITFLAILWTAKLRLAHPSHHFIDQLPRAIVFFPFFTLFIVDGSKLSARYGSANAALRSKKLLYIHLWRCLENVVGIALAVGLPRYTDFGVSSDGIVLAAGVMCAVIYVAAGVVFYIAADCSAERDANSANASNRVTSVNSPFVTPYYIAAT